jgi:hypothetical protein
MAILSRLSGPDVRSYDMIHEYAININSTYSMFST